MTPLKIEGGNPGCSSKRPELPFSSSTASHPPPWVSKQRDYIIGMKDSHIVRNAVPNRDLQILDKKCKYANFGAFSPAWRCSLAFQTPLQ